MKAYGGVDVQTNVFLTLTLVGGSGQLYTPAAFPSGKEPPVPIGYEDGWASEPVWMLRNRENS
jgi:hypothetical protein